MHLNSRLLFEKYAKPYFRSDTRVLEIGPDGFPSTYQEITQDPSIVFDTLDLRDHPELTYRAESEYAFPVPDNSYDIVLSGQVLEHVRKPWLWIREVTRVCRVGGLVITVCPVSWGYHEAPVDCWRVYPEGIRALYEESGLDVLLSTWESLELPGYSRSIPGQSLESYGLRRRVVFRLLGTIGFPVERAYDTIAVGRKKASGRL